MVDLSRPEVVLPIFVPALFCVISLLLSAIGGWRQLAAAYPYRSDRRRESWIWQSAEFGFVSYRSCVNVRAEDSHLSLAVALPFRIGHPPISIPWQEIRIEFGRRWFREVGALSFSGEPRVLVRFPRQLVERIATASGGQLRISSS